MNMQPMSLSQLILNNPEWMGVFANALFAVITIGVITWQGCMMRAQVRVMALQVRVMRWQGRLSARHERIQNRLIRLQHEHEWVLQRNREREQLLKLGRDLHLTAGCLREKSSTADHLHWEQLQDTIHELHSRLNILDVAVFSSENDGWFFNLKGYVDAVLKAVIDENSETPNLSTRKALKDADDAYKPINIFLDLEAAIRMEFFDFKNKWDDALPS